MRVRLHQPFDLSPRASGDPGGGGGGSEILRETDRVLKVRSEAPGPDVFQTIRGENLSSPGGRVETWDWDVGRRDLMTFQDVELPVRNFLRALEFSRGDFLFEKILSRSDDVVGSSGDDGLAGFGGDDRLLGGDGRDRLKGGAGDDALTGGRDDDRLIGGAGNDALDGNGGDDVLKGEAGDDLLRGGLGRDSLDGGAGRDRLEGGRAGDSFVFRPGGGRDVVLDFEIDVDRINLPGRVRLDDLRVADRDGGVLLILDGGDRMLLRGLTRDDVDQIEFF